MSGAKKTESGVLDPVNAKIQSKFDLVFPPVKAKASSGVFDGDIQFDTEKHGGKVMAEDNGSKGKDEKNSGLQIDLDFSLDDDTPLVTEKATASEEKPAAKGNDDLGFSLDFDLDAPQAASGPVETLSKLASDAASDSNGFSLDDVISDESDFNESTKKTVIINTSALTNSNLADFSLEKSSGSNSSAELMSTEEAKANMESTINDILRPKFETSEATQATVVGNLEPMNPPSALDNIEDSVLDFGGNTPSKGFSLESALDGSNAFSLDSLAKTRSDFTVAANEATREFDIDDLKALSMGDEEKTRILSPLKMPDFSSEPEEPELKQVPVRSVVKEEKVKAKAKVQEIDEDSEESLTELSSAVGGQTISTEDSIRFQATIRALREEREELLLQIKNLKADSKETQQDNLTLKANLDEAKIEITILRKRHMVELEDLKYRLTMSEEKKVLADEKARQAEQRREKLEQKVRIDFNQVKQREKELESKLELLSMDVDSQVQSRDQKILELRRKIDALEFNMENASIKEQKSLDDKRKLEDRLSKMMKTLRHSIKNLEDDIDHGEEDDDHQKEKN